MQRWGDPYGTGWMNWEAGLPDKARVASNVYDAFSAYRRSGGGARWANNNRGIFTVVTAVKKLRGDYGQ